VGDSGAVDGLYKKGKKLILYQSKYHFIDFAMDAIMATVIFGAQYAIMDIHSGSTSWVLSVVIVNLVIVYTYIRSYKNFVVLEDRLVIKYPWFIFHKDHLIYYKQIKSIKFRHFSKGPHSMIVVFENKKISYSFQHTFGIDMAMIFKLLKWKGVKLEIEEGFLPD
jgi:hypothetical protein